MTHATEDCFPGHEGDFSLPPSAAKIRKLSTTYLLGTIAPQAVQEGLAPGLWPLRVLPRERFSRAANVQ